MMNIQAGDRDKTYDAETLVIEPGNKVVLAGLEWGKVLYVRNCFYRQEQ